jgi:hypothetical protein
MQRLDILVFDLFNGHKAHVRTTHCLTNRRGIIGIVLVALAVGRDELGTDQTHVMAELPHRARPMVRTLTGFHANTTGGELGHKGQQFGAGQLLTDHHMALRIHAVELKHVLCQIDPEDGYLHDWTPLAHPGYNVGECC